MHENFDKKDDDKINCNEAEINPDLDHKMRILHLYGKAINITDRQIALEELSANAEKYNCA